MTVRLRGVWLFLIALAAPAKVLYDQDGVKVRASETVTTMEFLVHAPDTVYVSIRVDRNQNGRLDKGVDTMYSTTTDKKDMCTVLLLGPRATNGCGGFVSDVKLTGMRLERSEWEYTYSIPKRELGANSAWVSIEFWDSGRKRMWHFPQGGEDLSRSIHIAYEIKDKK
jgi:hypothetical protein